MRMHAPDAGSTRLALLAVAASLLLGACTSDTKQVEQWVAEVKARPAPPLDPLPVMKQCRDELMDLDLWNPLGQRALNARDNHPAWKKYTEFMPRAQVAMMEIPIYATYSLLSDLDALCERITTAEKRFREGPQKVIHTHRAA